MPAAEAAVATHNATAHKITGIVLPIMKASSRTALPLAITPKRGGLFPRATLLIPLAHEGRSRRHCDTCLSCFWPLRFIAILRQACAGETGLEPAPKEQPPRKLSGRRTAYVAILWRAGASALASHRRSKPA